MATLGRGEGEKSAGRMMGHQRRTAVSDCGLPHPLGRIDLIELQDTLFCLWL